MSESPQTFNDLFDFYQNQVKIYYSAVQADNELPLEVLFELNAALDHISRHYVYKEPESQTVEKAYSHFKRACLDIFKIAVRDTLDHYKELLRIDISLIDNGRFEKELRSLIFQIKRGSCHARQMEGKQRTHDEDGVPAFDLWVPVYENCLRFEQEFYLNDAIDWAKRKGKILSAKTLIVSVIVSAILGAFIRPFIENLLNSL